MTNKEKPTRGIDWAAIFKARPDLAPPDYYETIARLKAKQEKVNDP